MNITTDLAPLAHSVNTACARVGMSRGAFYKQLNAGAIKSFTVGRKRLIPESELQRFIRERVGA